MTFTFHLRGRRALRDIDVQAWHFVTLTFHLRAVALRDHLRGRFHLRGTSLGDIDGKRGTS